MSLEFLSNLMGVKLGSLFSSMKSTLLLVDYIIQLHILPVEIQAFKTWGSWILQDYSQLRVFMQYIVLIIFPAYFQHKRNQSLMLKQLSSWRPNIDHKFIVFFCGPSMTSMWYKMKYLECVWNTDQIHIFSL